MRLYSANIEAFYDHVRDNTLADTIRDNFKAHLGRYPGIPEYNSFKSSGQYVKNLAEKAALKDVHISFEYEVPYNTSRIDCLLFGRSAAAKSYVFLMELKQWAAVAELPGEDNFVETFTGGAHRRVAHPSAQVAGYHHHLKNFVKVFETDPDLDLFSCAYCHNYRKDGAAGLFAPKYNKLIAEFPVYTMTEVAGLAGKLKECLSSGHGLEVFNRFAQSPIEPSRKLLDNTAKIISGEKALSLLNEQIVAKNLILAKLEAAKARAEKSVIIVHGGPGTGKSVIAFSPNPALRRIPRYAGGKLQQKFSGQPAQQTGSARAGSRQHGPYPGGRRQVKSFLRRSRAVVAIPLQRFGRLPGMAGFHFRV